MSLFGITALALGLAMDAVAVAITIGVVVPQLKSKHMIWIAIFFGGFQALMPMLGWVLGDVTGSTLHTWGNRIGGVILMLLGIGMLLEARKEKAEERSPNHNHFALRNMLVLSFATSVDALSVGFTLPLLHAPFALTIAMVGIVTALFAALGLYVGHKFGAKLGPYAELMGGLILIGLGVQFLLG